MPKLTKIIYFLVPNPSNTAVLLLPSEDGWTLPMSKRVSRSRYVREQQICKDLLRVLKQELQNISVVSLRYRAFTDELSSKGEKISLEVDVMETCDPIIFPNEAIWVSKESLHDGIQISAQLQVPREILAIYLGCGPSSNVAHRLPWARHGWFRSVSSWVQRELSRRLEDVKVENIVPMSTKTTDKVLRFETLVHGNFYFKATHPILEEAKFTKWLSKLFPERVPNVLQFNEELNAMIMEDFSTTHQEAAVRDADFFAAIYRRFGRMQLRAIELMKDPENLIGLPKSKLLTPKLLASRVQSVLDHAEIRKLLTKAEIRKLQAQAPAWAEMCARLEDSGIPCTVVHLDLWDRNFALSFDDEQDVLFLDWTLGCITHPFVQLSFLRKGMGNLGVTEEHVESYLSLWRCFEQDIRELKKIESLASVARYLLYALGNLELACNCEPVEQKRFVTLNKANRDGYFANAARNLRDLDILISRSNELLAFVSPSA